MRPSRAIAPGDCAHLLAPNFFSIPAPAARFIGDSGMTQPGACRMRQYQSGMRGLMLQRSNGPWGAIDCRQPRYPRKISEDRRFCDPALRQVCLCQRSARRPRSTHLSWTDAVQVVLRCTSSRSHRRPVRREPSIDTHTNRNKGEFVAHRRHNSSSACAAGNELESYQRGADEISRAPLRLMSHALRATITHAPALLVHQPTVNAGRAFRTAHDQQARKNSRGARLVALHARRDVRTRSTASGRSTIATPSLRTMSALNGQKKEAGFPAPLAMTT